MSNNFCVYVHRRSDDNSIFYVGEGSLRRPSANCKYTRSKLWHSIVEQAGGFNYEILERGLSKEQAQILEKDVINKLRGDGIALINTCNNTQPLGIDETLLEELCSNFDYSDKSESGLIWKNGKHTGKRAGCQTTINGKSYWKVALNGRALRIHRIIVAITFRITLQANEVVNHIDGNGLNNQITNLQVCDQNTNMKNVNTRNNPHQGVSFNKRNNAWQARWQENSKQKCKSFSIRKFGDDAFYLALKHRQESST